MNGAYDLVKLKYKTDKKLSLILVIDHNDDNDRMGPIGFAEEYEFVVQVDFDESDGTNLLNLKEQGKSKANVKSNDDMDHGASEEKEAVDTPLLSVQDVRELDSNNKWQSKKVELFVPKLSILNCKYNGHLTDRDRNVVSDSSSNLKAISMTYCKRWELKTPSAMFMLIFQT